MKKPRSDSKLDALPPGRVEELRDGLLGGWSYEAARKWLADECQVKSSMAALSAFFTRHCRPVIQDRRQFAVLKADAILSGAGTDWDSASIERLRQMVFEFMANPNSDLEATERMFRLLLKSRDQEVDRRKLALLEAKAKQADAAKDVLSTKLSAEEQTRRLREILK